MWIYWGQLSTNDLTWFVSGDEEDCWHDQLWDWVCAQASHSACKVLKSYIHCYKCHHHHPCSSSPSSSSSSSSLFYLDIVKAKHSAETASRKASQIPGKGENLFWEDQPRKVYSEQKLRKVYSEQKLRKVDSEHQSSNWENKDVRGRGTICILCVFLCLYLYLGKMST